MTTFDKYKQALFLKESFCYNYILFIPIILTFLILSFSKLIFLVPTFGLYYYLMKKLHKISKTENFHLLSNITFDSIENLIVSRYILRKIDLPLYDDNPLPYANNIDSLKKFFDGNLFFTLKPKFEQISVNTFALYQAYLKNNNLDYSLLIKELNKFNIDIDTFEKDHQISLSHVNNNSSNNKENNNTINFEKFNLISFLFKTDTGHQQLIYSINNIITSFNSINSLELNQNQYFIYKDLHSYISSILEVYNSYYNIKYSYSNIKELNNTNLVNNKNLLLNQLNESITYINTIQTSLIDDIESSDLKKIKNLNKILSKKTLEINS